MTKPIILRVLFFILTALSSFGQGVWIQETVDAKTGLRTGKFEISGIVYEIKPNANLQGANLEGANLERANLERANLERANLRTVNLEGANLSFANVRRSQLSNANLDKANLRNINLELTYGSDVRLRNAIFDGASFKDSTFPDLRASEASGINANLEGAKLDRADFIRAKLEGAKLEGADLNGVDFNGAILKNANLKGANFSVSGNFFAPAKLQRANLQGAKLEGADVRLVNFLEANLSEANLQGAKLYRANFSEANLQGAAFQGANFGNSFDYFEQQFGSLLDSGNFNNHNEIKILETKVEANSARLSITPEQATAITSNTATIEGIISDVATQFETLGNNDTAIGEQLTTLGAEDILIRRNLNVIFDDLGFGVGNDRATFEQIDANRIQIEQIEKLVKPTDSSVTFNIVYQNIEDVSDQVTMVLEVPSNIIDKTPNLDEPFILGSSLSISRGDFTQSAINVPLVFNSNNVPLDLTKELVGQAGLSGRDVDNIVGDFGVGTGNPLGDYWFRSGEFLIGYRSFTNPSLDGQFKLISLKSDYEPPATIQSNKSEIDTLNENDQLIGEQLTSLGQNDILIGEQMTILGENDQSIGEQMATLSQNDETIMAEINAMKAQLQTLVASVAEKDAQIAEKDAEIAELKQGGGGQTLEQVLEQVQDARLGSVVLNPDAEGNMTLKLAIEESSDLSVWENSGESVEVELPLAEGKRFLPFALK